MSATDAVAVILVFLLREVVSLFKVDCLVFVIPCGIIKICLPPVEGGHGCPALLGLVNLNGVINRLERSCPVILVTKQADTQDKRIHVVRGLTALFVHKVQGLGFVLLLVQNLLGLLEVVVVAVLFF